MLAALGLHTAWLQEALAAAEAAAVYHNSRLAMRAYKAWRLYLAQV